MLGFLRLLARCLRPGWAAPGEGDLATVFGPGDAGEPTAAEWAGWAETLEHEIVTGLGPRLRRITVGEPSEHSEAPEAAEDAESGPSTLTPNMIGIR